MSLFNNVKIKLVNTPEISKYNINILSQGNREISDHNLSEDNEEVLSEDNEEVLSEDNDEVLSEDNDEVLSEVNDKFLSEVNDKFLSEVNDKFLSGNNEEVLSGNNEEVLSEVNQKIKKDRLFDMNFLNEDDYSYISDDIKWLYRLKHSIYRSGISVDILFVISAKLQRDLNNENFSFQRIVENLFERKNAGEYLSHLPIKNLDYNLRIDIVSCFVSTAVRFLILKLKDFTDEVEERRKFRERIQGEYKSFMENHYCESSELTYLFRFERAIRLLKTFTPKIKKTLFLKVGQLLEGSNQNIKYLNGGSPSRVTARRNHLIEHIYNQKPKKRAPKGERKIPTSKKQKK